MSPNNLIFPVGDLMHIISQLCSIPNNKNSKAQQSTTTLSLARYPLLVILLSLLSNLSKKEPDPELFDDPRSSEEQYQAICDILDQQNILDNGTYIGVY
jgi:hypothetical protein